jgi:mannose-6-phosphate isomerase
MYKIKGAIQHYAWGGSSFIPAFLSIENPEQTPHAEYWLGMHPGGPARVELSGNARTGLADMVRSEPRRYLGETVNNQFGELPFLLKILDVKGMLSIQVHPNQEDARKGFERENAEGIPLDAPHRNYKDANHKPEVMLALSDFYLLHGFRKDLAAFLDGHAQLGILSPILESSGLRGLYQYVMSLPQTGVDEMLQPLAQKIVPLYEAGKLVKTSPDFWAARVLQGLAPDYHHIDRGVFSIYFFNVLHLKPGQAIFQGAGVPHAYLEGQNIELMSNSDNVLRAGLTNKHMDIPELMRHTLFEGIEPQVMDGEQDGLFKHYPCPVADFRLDEARISHGEVLDHEASGPEIWIQYTGHAQWQGWRNIETVKGDSIFVPAGEQLEILCGSDARFFRASVPA